MAYEWTKVELYGANNDGNPRRYTIASSAAISKCQLLTLSDPRTAAAATTAGSVCAGVAAESHSGDDFSTSISVWTDGVFEAKASGAIAVGDPIMICSDSANYRNTVMLASQTASGAAIIGYALETASDKEVINVRLRL